MNLYFFFKIKHTPGKTTTGGVAGLFGLFHYLCFCFSAKMGWFFVQGKTGMAGRIGTIY